MTKRRGRVDDAARKPCLAGTVSPGPGVPAHPAEAADVPFSHARRAACRADAERTMASDTYVPFNVPGAIETSALDINDSAQIVGTYRDRGGQHGFLANGGTFTSIDYPGGTDTRGLGINDAGHVVGSYMKGGTNHGFIYKAGRFRTLDYPGDRATAAVGINDDGLVTGTYADGDGVHGFAFKGGPTRN